MRHPIPLIATGLLLAVFAAAGCGGGGESTTAGAGKEANAGAGAKGDESPNGAESPSASSGLGGAGGETESGAGAGGKSGKEDFIVKANALCAKRLQQVQTGVREIVENAKGGSQQAVVRELIDRAVAPRLEAEAAELTALEPPPGDAGKIEEIIAVLEAEVAEARKDPQEFVASTDHVFSHSEDLARAYGIGSCGRAT